LYIKKHEKIFPFFVLIPQLCYRAHEFNHAATATGAVKAITLGADLTAFAKFAFIVENLFLMSIFPKDILALNHFLPESIARQAQ